MNNSTRGADCSHEGPHKYLRRLVGITFAAAVSSVPAWAQAPDTILQNAKIFTSNAGQPWVEALAIRGERVSAFGASDLILQLAGANTRVVDLAGLTVVPGF